METADVLVLFTDIRGFTKWSTNTEVFATLAEFVGGFVKILGKHFPKKDHLIKGLGDGALIVRELDAPLRPPQIKALLADTLTRIAGTDDDFRAHCAEYAARFGEGANLRLGWGVVRGKAVEVKGDYLGPNLNKAARLCDAARPYGIVIDQRGFPELPQSRYTFAAQLRKLSGLEDTDVWVTAEIGEWFLTREKLRQTPEVHVAGMCVDTNSKAVRVLIAKRNSQRRLYPDLWEGCGGQLASSETFAEGVVRHFKLEMGIDVRVVEDLHLFYRIEIRDHPVIPGIRFVCETVGDRPPESPNHTEVRWVGEKELRGMPAADFVPGVKEDFLTLIERYKEYRRR